MATRDEQLARAFEPAIRNALEKAFLQLRNSIKLKTLITAIETRGIVGALDVMEQLRIEGVIDAHLTDELNKAVSSSGRMIAQFLPPGAFSTAIPFRFDIINPLTVEFLRKYQLNLIQRIGANTREAVRQAVQTSIITGKNPRQTSLLFRDTLGLTPRQEQAVRNFENSLRSLDKAALRRVLRDKRFDPTVIRAIEQGKPLSESQIARMAQRYRERYIKHRAETIARTEAMRAVAMGEYEGFRQGIANGNIQEDQVRRFWVFTHDNKTRNAHRIIPQLNETGVGVNDSFQTPLGPLLFPRDPNGTASNTINCRCSIRYEMVENL